MALNSIEELVEDIRQGKMVILMDDEDRENEGDIIMAAECCQPEHINFMAKHAELDGAGVIAARDDFADAVDVAADQVTAQAGGRGQGFFQVDRAAALQVVEGGALEGFAADVGPETVARQVDSRQADAVDGNAVAEFDVAQVKLAGLDVDAHVTALGGQATDGADGFDDAGEHAVVLANRAALG